MVLTGYLKGQAHITPPPQAATLRNVLFRIALDAPQRAAWVSGGLTLMEWARELDGLVAQGPPPSFPEDPEARWIRMLAEKPHLATREATLTLRAGSLSWPPGRHLALAGHLMKIVTAAIQTHD
jgi:hypothetical protein